MERHLSSGRYAESEDEFAVCLVLCLTGLGLGSQRKESLCKQQRFGIASFPKGKKVAIAEWKCRALTILS
jgi:hypothetical protein